MFKFALTSDRAFVVHWCIFPKRKGKLCHTTFSSADSKPRVQVPNTFINTCRCLRCCTLYKLFGIYINTFQCFNVNSLFIKPNQCLFNLNSVYNLNAIKGIKGVYDLFHFINSIWCFLLTALGVYCKQLLVFIVNTVFTSIEIIKGRVDSSITLHL